MKALHGAEAIAYLKSLKKYEIGQANKKRPGERVQYYKVQVGWINEELKKVAGGIV